jgi:xylulose-5-phosphate/fructose-6-phosphate phosphoketolase
MHECLQSTDRINVVVADKQALPQWVSLGEALAQARTGMAIWHWASNGNVQRPDVVLAAAGDHPTLETLAAAGLLRQFLPDLNLRYVNVGELNVLGDRSQYPHAPDDATFQEVFTEDRPVIFSFHGYPATVKLLLFDRPGAARVQIAGYTESGTTTTPFDMQVRNETSRYHLAMRVASAARGNPSVERNRDTLITYCLSKLDEHHAYIREHGVDLPEVTGWSWHHS